MHRQRIKIIQESNSYKLERAVNEFISGLDRSPIKMDFRVFSRYYEDSKTPWPEHIAYITFIENE